MILMSWNCPQHVLFSHSYPWLIWAYPVFILRALSCGMKREQAIADFAGVYGASMSVARNVEIRNAIVRRRAEAFAALGVTEVELCEALLHINSDLA